MIRKKQGEIEWLEFELLADQSDLAHGIFLRHGGVSTGAFRSLNAGGKTGDDADDVAENRRRMMQVLKIECFVEGRQVHGDKVVLVEEKNQEIGDCDALITDKTNIALMIKHADCQAGVFYDPVHHALANVHSGWRGNVKNIYQATVQKMVETFGSKPEDLLVGISPSLGPHHAEFKNYQVEFPKDFWSFQVRPEYFDLWAIARHQLQACGVLPHHIEIAGICTYANQEDYYSYRRDKTTGRHATFAMLRN